VMVGLRGLEPPTSPLSVLRSSVSHAVVDLRKGRAPIFLG
jgi:hypothetical protein